MASGRVPNIAITFFIRERADFCGDDGAERKLQLPQTTRGVAIRAQIYKRNLSAITALQGPRRL
jgi:hypothetical protein